MIDVQLAYQTCLERLEWSFRQLGVEVPPGDCAQIALLIAQPMTGPWRFFHTLQHLVDVGGGIDGSGDPVEVLAALFHDLVYVQVDYSINLNLSYYLSPFIQERQGKLQVRSPNSEGSPFEVHAGEGAGPGLLPKGLPPEGLPPEGLPPQDRMFELVCGLFGVAPGQTLNPFGGQNEFLSALIAARVLEPWLSLPQILAIAAAIEATIPFRAAPDPEAPGEILCGRLRTVQGQLQLGLSEAELERMVMQAVRVANRDVWSFAHPSAAHFLANTWNLLPETNHNLIPTGGYSVTDYRQAIAKMEGFMGQLNSQAIFRRFRQEPDALTFAQWSEQAALNLTIGRLYLGCKLVTISLIEALSSILGLDVPLSLLMGGVHHQAVLGQRMEHFLPGIVDGYEPRTEVEIRVLSLLKDGRAEANHTADLKDSPLAAFLVQSLGFEEMQVQLERTRLWLRGEMSHQELVDGMDRLVVRQIVEAVVQLFDYRKRCFVDLYLQQPVSAGG